MINQRKRSSASRTRQIYGLSHRQFSDALIDGSFPDPIQPTAQPHAQLAPPIVHVLSVPQPDHDADDGPDGPQQLAGHASSLLADILFSVISEQNEQRSKLIPIGLLRH